MHMGLCEIRALVTAAKREMQQHPTYVITNPASAVYMNCPPRPVRRWKNYPANKFANYSDKNTLKNLTYNV